MRSAELLSTLSLILFYTAIPLLLPLGYAYYFNEPTTEAIATSIFVMMLPAIPVFIPQIFKWLSGVINTVIILLFKKEAPWNYALTAYSKRQELSKLKFGDILAVTSLAWLVIPIITAYPYVQFGLSPIDALFESMSGWTSTGLSLIAQPENMYSSIILFRSVTQWIGGLGILILMLSFMRHRQAQDLLAFEAKNSNDIGIKNAASRIWKIYLFLTALSIAAVALSGFDLLTATNLGFAGISNGGFFPFSAYPFIWVQKIVLALTMFLGAISFTTYAKLRFAKIGALLGEEFLLYLSLIIVFSSLIFFFGHDALANTMLNTISAIACGGFAIGDLSIMHEFSIFMLIILMVCGGMYGSTTGGLKLWRILVALKMVFARIRSYFLPEGAVQVIKVDGVPVHGHSISEVFGYIFMYIFLLVVFSAVFISWDFGIIDSLFIVASAMGNVGLSTINLAVLDLAQKSLLIAIMYLGRIEILPLLALFRFAFGRK